MSQYVLWFSFLSLILAGCAERKYEVLVHSDRLDSQQVTDSDLEMDRNTIECTLKFKNSDLCVLWAWDILPTPQQPGILNFKITRENLLDGSPLPTDTLDLPAVVLWMPSMSHGSTPTRVERVDTGSLRATQVFFIMPGDWEIRFQIIEGGQIQDEAVLTLII